VVAIAAMRDGVCGHDCGALLSKPVQTADELGAHEPVTRTECASVDINGARAA